MAALQEEVNTARETAYFAEQMKLAKQRTQDEEKHELSLEESRLSSLLEQKNHEVRLLKDEQDALKADLISLQNKLNNVTSLAKQLMDENETVIRQKTCQVRVLRANTGQGTPTLL